MAAAALAGTGACYTSPINMAPTISIDPPMPMYRGTDLTFTARPSDPDNDRLEVEWTHNLGDCPAVAPSDIKSRDSSSYTVPSQDTDGPFCVWAIVRDHYDATTRRSYPAHPTNRDPNAKILVTGTKETYPPFSLYRPFQMEAMAVDPDDDGLEFVWTLSSDAGDVILDGDLPSCPGRGPDARCWTPVKSGMYTASVSITDGHGGHQLAETEPFRVAEDMLPCLGMTEPPPNLFRAADDKETIRIRVLSVDDDGDPFSATDPEPTGITFTWFEATDNGPMVRKDNTESFHLLFPDDRNLGKTIHVRVEIADRNLMRSRQRFEGCGDNDVCSSDVASACRQRMTWSITYGL